MKKDARNVGERGQFQGLDHQKMGKSLCGNNVPIVREGVWTSSQLLHRVRKNSGEVMK